MDWLFPKTRRFRDVGHREGFGGDRAVEQASEPFLILNAAIAGDVQSIQKHLAGGRNLNETEQVGGNTPLMLAATFGNREAAILLIQAGADPTSVNACGITPLELAREQMDSDWKAVYEHTYQMLSLELDFEALADAHTQIRNIFERRSINIESLM